MYLNFTKSETGPTLNIREFINYALDFDVNNPYVRIEDEVIVMFDEGDDTTNNQPFEEHDNAQFGDVVVDFMDIGSTIVALKKNLIVLHLLSKAFEHFRRKLDLGMHKNLIKLLKICFTTMLIRMMTFVSRVFQSFI
jgi:hypothetical protein